MSDLNAGFSNNRTFIAFGGTVTQVATDRTLSGGTYTLNGSTNDGQGILTGQYERTAPYARTVVKRGFSATFPFDTGDEYTEGVPSDNDQGHFGPDGDGT